MLKKVTLFMLLFSFSLLADKDSFNRMNISLFSEAIAFPSYKVVDGGLISNTEDWVKFFQALNEGDFLDSTTWSEMTKISDEKFDNSEPGFIGFSPGLSHQKTKYGSAIDHWGDIHGFHGVALFFPESGTYISVLINTFSLAYKFISSEELYDYFF